MSFDGAHINFVDGHGTATSIAVSGATPAGLQNATFQHLADGHGGTEVFWQAGRTHTYVGTTDGAWDDAGNWNDGIAPGAYDEVTIGGTDPLKVNVVAGTTALANHLIVNSSATTITVAGQLSLGIDPTLGGATIAVEAEHSSLVGDTTLSNGTLTLADGLVRAAPDPRSFLNAGTTQRSLTVAADASIIHEAGATNAAGVSVEGAFVNEGTITANVAQGRLTIQSSSSPTDTWTQPSIVNAGTISVSGGDALQVSVVSEQLSSLLQGSGFINSGTLTVGSNSSAMFDVAQWTNTGTVAIGEHASATVGSVSSNLPGLAANWSNSGVISIGSGGSVTFYGGFATASLQSIINSGTVHLNGFATDDRPISVTGGTWIVDPNSLSYSSSTSGSLIPTNRYVIGDHTTLELAEDTQFSPILTRVVQFLGSNSTLIVDHLNGTLGPASGSDSSSGGIIASPSLVLSGLAAGDSIDITQAGINSVQLVSNGFLISGSFGSTFISSDRTFNSDEVSVGSDGFQGTRLTFHADTTAPVITAVTAQASGSGGGVLPSTMAAGQDVTLLLSLREPVLVTGTPVLRLSNGAVASYVSGSGSDTLSFSFTVQTSQDTSDLRLSSFDFSHGVIADGAGNSLSTSFAGVSGADLGVAINTQTPTVQSVTAPQGVFQAGQTEAITLQFSEPVTITGGVPILLLSNAGQAIYDPAATQKLGDPTRLIFSYKVSATDVSSTAPQITGLAANGAAIVNAAGTGADLSLAENRSLTFGVDTNPPTTGNSGVTYFLAQGTGGGDQQLWQSDGTAAGTHRVDLGDSAYFGVSKPVITANAVYVTVQKAVPDPIPRSVIRIPWVADRVRRSIRRCCSGSERTG